MKLTHLQADGLKSLTDVSLDVPKLLALHGPNGSGKTSLHQAIKIAVLGHDPAIGKTLSATRMLSGGKGDIEVGLTFDSGFGIRRSAGRSLETDVAPPEGEETEKEKQERINRETGAFIPSFDLASLLELSAEKRRAALFALLPRRLAGLDQDSYRHWLGYEDATNAVKRAIDKLWLEQIVSNESPTEGLASAIAFAREKFLEADRERQAQEKVVEAADRDAEASTQVVTEESADDLAVIQGDLSAVEQALGKLREQQSASERRARQIAERKHRQTVLADRIMQGEVEVRRLLDQRDSLPNPDPEAAQKAALHLEEVERQGAAKIAEAERAHSARWEEAAAARDRLSKAQADLDAAAAKRSAAVAKWAELETLEECPVCGSTEDLDRVRKALKIQAETAAGEVEALEAERAAARGEYEVLNAQVVRLRSALEEARAEADRLSKEARAAVLRAQEGSAAAKRLTHDIRQAEQLLAAAREEAEGLNGSDLASLPDPETFAEDIRGKEEQAFDLRERIRKLQDLAKAAGKAEAARERADQHRRTLAGLTDRAAALKTLYGALQKYRAHVIQQMVAPVEETANQLLQKIDPAKRFSFIFERESKDTFDFGFTEDGAFRSYDAASTGEDAFLAVVFVAALIAAVQPEWRVLLVDNAEQVDDERRRDLMEALALVEDQFDNIILSGCCEFAAVPGWQVIPVRSLTGALVGA